MEPSRCLHREQGEEQLSKILEAGITTFVSLQVCASDLTTRRRHHHQISQRYLVITSSYYYGQTNSEGVNGGCHHNPR